MFTRCPGCHTVHPVNAALLASGNGRYRCGKCNKVTNALDSLFDEWPAAGAKAPASGDMPVLGVSLDLEAAARSRRTAAVPDEPEEATDAGREGGRPTRWAVRGAWVAGAVAIAVVAAFQVAKFQGEPLLERAPVQSALVRMGLRDPPPATPFRDLERIHLVSRELRSDSGRGGRLRLNATIVNRAPRNQPWPDLEITLLDAAGGAVSRETFEPSDYLAAGSDASKGMAPQAYLPLVVEMDDPGRRAVSFELAFR